MKKEIIRTQEAPSVIGPYVQAIKTENLIFLSGQIPLDPASNKLIKGAIFQQTQRVMENIKAILKAGGSSLDKVIKTTVYLKNLSDFAEMNRVYESYFKEIKPARSCVEVANLPKGALIEIETIALV